MKLTLIVSENCDSCERAKVVLKNFNLKNPTILTEYIDINSYSDKRIIITPALLINDKLFTYGEIDEELLEKEIN